EGTLGVRPRLPSPAAFTQRRMAGPLVMLPSRVVQAPRGCQLARPSRQEHQRERYHRREGLDEEDPPVHGRRPEDPGDDDAGEEEDLGRPPGPPRAGAPAGARGEETVVEPLVRGQGLGRRREVGGEPEDPPAGGLRPEEHLEDQEIEMEEGDEADEDVGGSGGEGHGRSFELRPGGWGLGKAEGAYRSPARRSRSQRIAGITAWSRRSSSAVSIASGAGAAGEGRSG